MKLGKEVKSRASFIVSSPIFEFSAMSSKSDLRSLLNKSGNLIRKIVSDVSFNILTDFYNHNS